MQKICVSIFLQMLACVCLAQMWHPARFQHQSVSISSGSVDDPERGSSIFDEIAPKIRSSSEVPLILPRYLPFFGKDNPIYAELRSVSRSSYDVLLANALPCEGADWCLYGSVRGANSAFDHTFNHVSPKVRPVRLHRGIAAGFIEAECATYCTQAYIEWREKGFYYSIGMKAGKREQLVKMANSAIDSFASSKFRPKQK